MDDDERDEHLAWIRYAVIWTAAWSMVSALCLLAVVFGLVSVEVQIGG